MQRKTLSFTVTTNRRIKMSFYNKLKKCGISVNELRNSEILITGATGMIGSVG